MHDAAFAYVAAAVAEHGPFYRVVEFGSLDINGTVRSLFDRADYIGVDLHPGPCVDVVADAAQWTPDDPVDCVVCCEVLEHTAEWPQILCSAFRCLRPGGVLILTAAGVGRGPHSAVDGNALRDGEHYANIDTNDLVVVLAETGFADIRVDTHDLDIRATARKPA